MAGLHIPIASPSEFHKYSSMIQPRLRFIPLLACLFAVVHLAAQSEPAPSNLWPAVPVPKKSDETSLKIIGLHLKARGGTDNLSAIRNVESAGTIVEGLVDHYLTVTISRPQSIHMRKYRYHLGYDNTSILSTDGKRAWKRITQPEMKLPQPVGGWEAVQLGFEAMLPFLFSDRERLGAVFLYRGEKEIAGRKTYVLHGWLPSGIQIEVFFDTKSFQIINYRHPYRIGTGNVLVDRMPTGLAKSGNVWWETGYTLQHRGKIFQTVSYDHVRANIEIEPDLFSMPKVKEFWLRPKNGSN